MANASTQITLDQLTDAVLASITAQFPDLATVDAYPEDEPKITAPACLIEMEEMEPDVDAGTGQTSMRTRWVAHVVIGFGRTPVIKRQARMLVAALATHVYLNRWGLPVEPAQLIGAYPDEFTPGLDRYEAWRLEWTQVVDFGPSVWDGSGITPTQIMLGYAPDVGTGHEDDYHPVSGLPEVP